MNSKKISRKWQKRCKDFYPDDYNTVAIPVIRFPFWSTNFIILFTQTLYIEPLMNYLALFIKVWYSVIMVPVQYIYDSLIVNMMNTTIMNGHIKLWYSSAASNRNTKCCITTKSNQYFWLYFQPTFQIIVTSKKLSVRQQSAMERPK